MVNAANKRLAVRYFKLIESQPHDHFENVDVVLGLLTEIVSCSSAQMAPDKSSRWIGYIQSHLISWGLTTIENERDSTRDLFQQIYTTVGIKQQSINVKGNTP